MSSLEPDPEVGRDDRPVATDAELLDGAPVALGGPRGLPVTRTLPNKQRRTVGAWCFLDAYGPHDLAVSDGMRVGPHPHMGLQTVSWLTAGEVLHRDSLGHLQEIRPGRLNLMTAGRGISHSEETPAVHSGVLAGVQLWVALPDSDRDRPPAFTHHDDLPVAAGPGFRATVLMGEFDGVVSPARTFTPLAGAEVALTGGPGSLPLRADFEYAVLALDGAVTVDGVPLKPGPLLYLEPGRSALRFEKSSPVRLMLLGGEPFAERLVMWWNFVGRTHEDIAAAREDWESGSRFGAVHGYAGGRIPAPPMPITRLVARGRVR